ncbi:MAG TPA: ATP-dependent Clp protease adaptor ClpS [Kofleriaceae bacterium]|nr:ATP-dependent Clp protease adaptor ClpS [Kofleriaceae bacterium]
MDPVTIVGMASLVGVGWWLRRAGRATRRLAAGSPCAEDAEIAMHVAVHEVKARKQPWLSSIHLLYGLVQDEAVVAAIRAAGGDPEVLEDRLLSALDEHRSTIEGGQEAERVFGYAVAVAQARRERASCVDLWAGLSMHGASIGALFDAARIDPASVLFHLFHGAEPPIADAMVGHWDVVLRNDHYTTKEFVVEVLEQVFAFPPAEAETHMQTVHEQGRAAVARLRAGEARAKVLEARRRARAHGFPLWIGVEPT